MILLAENAELRNEMGKAAREKLEKEYSLERHCKNLIENYVELVA